MPGVVEVSELRSRFGFMAYHGGALEEATDRIARAAAEASGASLYVVLHPPPDPAHIASTLVRPAESPALAAFIAHVEVVVTVHGYGRDGMFTSLLLGGRNRDLAEQIAAELAPDLDGYDVVTDLERIPRELRGPARRQPGEPAAARPACSSSCRPVCADSAPSGSTGRATTRYRRWPH